MQALSEKKWAYALLFVALSAGAVYLRSTGIEVSNANINVLVCMPFFLIGLFLKPAKEQLSNLHNYYLEASLLVTAIVLVIICGNYNGYVWMYLCEYGDYFALYITGGVAGFVMLYVVSLWLSRLPYKNMIVTLSKGSILIIGLHIIIVRRLTELPDRMFGEDLIMTVLIIFAFFPLIRLSEVFFPILLGQRHI